MGMMNKKSCKITIELLLIVILNTLTLIEGVLLIPTVHSNAYLQIFISCISVVVLTLVFNCKIRIILIGQLVALMLYIGYDVFAQFGGFSFIIGFIVVIPTILFTLCWKLVMYVYEKKRK